MAIKVMSKLFDTKAWSDGKPQPAGDAAYVVSFEGRVLETRERNGYDDSDFYALVWDDETETIKSVDYATTRGWSYPNGATVDATDEVIVKATAYRTKAAILAAKAAAAEEAKVPRKGRTVKVVKGRKVPVGTVAEVGWFGKDRYSDPSWYGNPNPLGLYFPSDYRVGLRIDGEMIFTSASNVEVLINEEVSA